MLDLQELSDNGTLFDGHYRLLYPLSTEGATADVWLAIDENTVDEDMSDEDDERREETGMRVAIKVYRPKNALDVEGEQRFRDEYKIVYECRHANLLQPTGFSIYNNCPYLVLPFCENGSSEKLIRDNLSEDEIWKFIMDVSSGLNRLHTNNPQIVHQDIKPANILIDNMHNYAITDFGISSKRGGVHGYFDEEKSGTMAYMAPERFLEGNEPMPQSDIWAFGATLFEILTGEVPFGENGGKNQERSKASMPQMPGVSSTIQHLVYACLEYEVGNRPTAQELMDAARHRQFPPKHTVPIWVGVALTVVLCVGIGVWLSRPSSQLEISPAALYDSAYHLMESDDSTSFMCGYRLMDSLSRSRFVPAMQDIAYTRGIGADSAYRHRKDMLKIAYDRNGIPIDEVENNQSVALLESILELNDSAYACINKQVAYRLAVYYYNRGTVFGGNYKKSLSYLDVAQEWASLDGDSASVDIIRKRKDEIVNHN